MVSAPDVVAPSAISPLTITVLGCGTSSGVPVIACDCAVCRSSDPFNKRLRPSILVSVPGDERPRNILVDTTPDMRMQMLRGDVQHVDSVLITHVHADHIFGMDDLRQFNFRHNVRIPVYGTPEVLEHLRMVFAYCFQETQSGGGKPQLDLETIAPFYPLTLYGQSILPLMVLHGRLPITAFKFGQKFAYVTDVSEIPAQTLTHLYGLDTLVLDAVRHEPHPTHFGLGQALEVIAEVKPRRAYLTHLSHHFDYVATNAELPAGVELAYDGLRFTVPLA